MIFRFIHALTVLLISPIQAFPAKRVWPSSLQCSKNQPVITVTSTLIATSTIPTFHGFTPIISPKTSLNARAESTQVLPPDGPNSFKVWYLNPTALTAAPLPPLETCGADGKPPTTTATRTITASLVDAACASDNLVSCVPGSEHPITGFKAKGSASDKTIITPSAYECCVACQTLGCAWDVWVPGELVGDCHLFFQRVDQCDGAKWLGSTFLGVAQSEKKKNGGYTVSNGPCGQIRQGASGS
ncbi:MAG: hypothetical protein LQ342_004941 [Letrouitia transgressa]|nr:MAG: hypothetical protein LQ342_004941 [Letrouitia transgressa]